MKNKGCVVEVRSNTLVLMTASCEFIEIPKSSRGLVVPGMEVEYETRPQRLASHKKWLAVAAVFMVFILGSLLIMPPTSAMPVYMASIDINPSMNLFIDETGHVVEIQPMNQEAKKLNTRNLQGKTVEEVVSSLMEQLFDQGYFTDQVEHYMVFSLSAIDTSVPEEKVTEMMLRLQNTIQVEKQTREIQLEVLSFAAREEEVDEAESQELSLNHLLVRNQYQEMMKQKPPESMKEPSNQSMDTMVRTILKEKEHPVFQEHPGADPGGDKVRNEDVTPPGAKRSDDGEQTSEPQPANSSEQPPKHPVFEDHPGSPSSGRDDGNESDSQQNDQHESQGNNGGNGKR